MKEFKIDCVSRWPRSGKGRHEDITHIGNRAGQWRLTRQDAIAQIHLKISAFYTIGLTSGEREYIDIVREPSSAPYLRSHANGYWNDNLLMQAHCGGNCKTV